MIIHYIIKGSTSLHEAQMYQGGNPDQFIINTQLLDNTLIQGNNVLSLQVHNDNISSSDLTGRIFLSLGIHTTSTNYSPTPSWFQHKQDGSVIQKIFNVVK